MAVRSTMVISALCFCKMSLLKRLEFYGNPISMSHPSSNFQYNLVLFAIFSNFFKGTLSILAPLRSVTFNLTMSSELASKPAIISLVESWDILDSNCFCLFFFIRALTIKITPCITVNKKYLYMPTTIITKEKDYVKKYY